MVSFGPSLDEFCRRPEKVAERFQYIEKELQTFTKYSTKALKFIIFCSIMVKTLDRSKSCVLVTLGISTKREHINTEEVRTCHSLARCAESRKKRTCTRITKKAMPTRTRDRTGHPREFSPSTALQICRSSWWLPRSTRTHPRSLTFSGI